jgi:4-hydroxybutyrate CoA-transferase
LEGVVVDWREDYKKKLTTAAEAVKTIKNGDQVIVGHAYGQPQHLVNAMVASHG